MPSQEEFDWSDRSRIAVHPVQAIAVYRSREGVVIRQQRSPDGKGDAQVTIPDHSVTNVVNRLRALQDDLPVEETFDEVSERVLAIVD
jgi:hypothetical protein